MDAEEMDAEEMDAEEMEESEEPRNAGTEVRRNEEMHGQTRNEGTRGQYQHQGANKYWPLWLTDYCLAFLQDLQSSCRSHPSVR